jgi:acyl-CoA thioesterase YciA
MELISTHIVMTHDVGLNGNLFGGRMLAWLDEDGAAFASASCEAVRVVTVKFAETNFKRPAKVGMQIKVYGQVTRVGNTSVTIHMEARAYDVENCTEKLITDTDVIFVRQDQHGDPVPFSEKVKAKYANKS